MGYCMVGGMCGRRGVHDKGHVWQGDMHGRRAFVAGECA